MESLARKHLDFHLFWVSALLLFLEILLIRWISVEVRIFAYLTNLVLISAFLGAGLGAYHAARPGRLWPASALLAFIVLWVSHPPGLQELSPTRITDFLASLSGYAVWEAKPIDAGGTAIGLLLTILVFALIAAVFYPIGQLMGRLFNAHPKVLTAYAMSIAGSIFGIWVFVALSALSTPPVTWFGVAAVFFLYLAVRAGGAERLTLPFLAVVLACVALAGGPNRTIWSPYQKLTLLSDSGQAQAPGRSRHVILVNNAGYQAMLDLSGAASPASPGELWRSQYNLPYRFLPDGGPDDVLIVGAGSGNDAAGALRNGARYVDAVEIDSEILSLGRELHPEHPYDSPRVHAVVDDARSFFKRTARRYDLVWFGLLDSHTLGSAYNNIRLDHYVYTVESLREAAALLKPGGLVVMTFSVQYYFIAQRICGLFHAVFGAPPLTFVFPYDDLGWGGVCFVSGSAEAMRGVTARLATQRAVDRFVRDQGEKFALDTPITTDDWPYLYNPAPGIPNIHIIVTSVLLALLFLGKRFLLGATRRIDRVFFGLGAGFLLLEVQNISKASLLFGGTWIVNSFIITAILLMALLSTLFVARYAPGRRGLSVAWVLLAATLSLNYFLPLDLLNRLSFPAKFLLANVILTSPMFFAGVLFSSAFAATADKAAALGANLVGAIIGGLAESLSFAIGVRALLLVAMLFYLVAWLGDRHRAEARAT